jgi:hypothetical protein
MIPKLEIVRLEPGTYQASVQVSGQDITEPTLHGSIAEALRSVGEGAPREMFGFVEVSYQEGSIGTRSLERLAADSAALATELTDVVHGIRLDDEARDADRKRGAALAHA